MARDRLRLQSIRRSEIYVQTFPGAAHRRKVSSNGAPMFGGAATARKLYYLSTDFKLMAVPMRMVNGEPDPGPPVPLVCLSEP